MIFAYAGIEYEDVRIPLIKFTEENVASKKFMLLFLNWKTWIALSP